MRILFTGASSFSGRWFAEELVKAGHEVCALFLRPLEAYTDLRRLRVNHLLERCRCVFQCPFGSDIFLKIIDQGHWDLFCHHAADVTNYKSPDFDPVAALSKNTLNLAEVFKILKAQGCLKIVLTGSVFEQNEGVGSDGLRAVSPYGLSKGLTSDLFKYYAHIAGLRLGKFVIPNPFGPYEEARFTAYLMKNWQEEKVAEVSAPLYVRDNVPISLLAKAYVFFVQKLYLQAEPGFDRFNPSYYAESQGAFTARMANEIAKRTNLPCHYVLKHQTQFLEPRIRINTDALDVELLQWNETEAWDQFVSYYVKEGAAV